jgi:hypothetical protein
VTWQPLLDRVLGTNRIERAELRASRLAHAAANQRNRRAKHRRIDYYVSEAALAIINAQTKAQAGYDTSSVINRLIESVRQPTSVLPEPPSTDENLWTEAKSRGQKDPAPL